jgi:DNA-directed RNA polymerase II subunit RPB3
VESAGNLEPDAIVQQAINVMQRKLAAVISTLTGVRGEGDRNGVPGAEEEDILGGVRSPDAYEPPEGIDGGFTAYGANSGGHSAWGGAGGTTPYGATPYGQSSYGF